MRLPPFENRARSVAVSVAPAPLRPPRVDGVMTSTGNGPLSRLVAGAVDRPHEHFATADPQRGRHDRGLGEVRARLGEPRRARRVAGADEHGRGAGHVPELDPADAGVVGGADHDRIGALALPAREQALGGDRRRRRRRVVDRDVDAVEHVEDAPARGRRAVRRAPEAPDGDRQRARAAAVRGQGPELAQRGRPPADRGVARRIAVPAARDLQPPARAGVVVAGAGERGAAERVERVQRPRALERRVRVEVQQPVDAEVGDPGPDRAGERERGGRPVRDRLVAVDPQADQRTRGCAVRVDHVVRDRAAGPGAVAPVPAAGRTGVDVIAAGMRDRGRERERGEREQERQGAAQHCARRIPARGTKVAATSRRGRRRAPCATSPPPCARPCASPTATGSGSRRG